MLRVIYSRSDLERHRAFISVDPLTVEDLVLSMRQMLKVVSRIVLGVLCIVMKNGQK